MPRAASVPALDERLLAEGLSYASTPSLFGERYGFTTAAVVELFTQNGLVNDETPLRDHLRRCAVACAYVEPGATERFSVTAQPGYLWFTNGPARIGSSSRTRRPSGMRS
jgi:hypothetical protein